MKVLLFILIAAIKTNAICQTKGDIKIFAATPITAHALKTILFDNGYSVTNDDSMFIATSIKELKGPVAVKMMFVRTDTGVYVKGLMKPTQSVELWGVKSENEFEVVKYIGKNLMLAKWVREPWNELDRIAKLISERVEYFNH